MNTSAYNIYQHNINQLEIWKLPFKVNMARVIFQWDQLNSFVNIRFTTFFHIIFRPALLSYGKNKWTIQKNNFLIIVWSVPHEVLGLVQGSLPVHC